MRVLEEGQFRGLGPQLPGFGRMDQRFGGGRDSEASIISLCEINSSPCRGLSSPLLGAFKLDNSFLATHAWDEAGRWTRICKLAQSVCLNAGYSAAH